MDADLSHVRQLIYSSATESEKIELRKKWLGPDGAEQISTKVETMNATSNGYLEQKVDECLALLVKSRREAAYAEAQRQRDKVLALNGTLRTALSEKFIREAGISIRDGKATIPFRDKSLVLTYDGTNFLLDSEKLKEVPGTISDKIIATLTMREDF